MASVDDFNAAFARFLAASQEVIDAHMAANFPTLPRVTLSAQIGKRYIRVVRDGTSAHCFVDTTNGDILKCDSWKAPAKGARGSIYSQDPTSCMTWCGVKYLR